VGRENLRELGCERPSRHHLMDPQRPRPTYKVGVHVRYEAERPEAGQLRIFREAARTVTPAAFAAVEIFDRNRRSSATTRIIR
jgi:hypothetical protein